MGMVQDLYTIQPISTLHNLNDFMITPLLRHECPQISENVASFQN